MNFQILFTRNGMIIAVLTILIIIWVLWYAFKRRAALAQIRRALELLRKPDGCPSALAQCVEIRRSLLAMALLYKEFCMSYEDLIFIARNSTTRYLDQLYANKKNLLKEAAGYNTEQMLPEDLDAELLVVVNLINTAERDLKQLREILNECKERPAQLATT